MHGLMHGPSQPSLLRSGFVQYIFIAIQIASIGVLGDELREGRDDNAQRLFSSSLGLACICGVVALAAMTVFPTDLVNLTGVQDPQVVRSITPHDSDLTQSDPTNSLDIQCL